MTFQQEFAFGRMGENAIAQYLCARGMCVQPVYEVELEQGTKGPRIYSAAGELIAPDLLTFNKTRAVWIEAKRKSRCTWHRKSGQWQTGIDIPYYDHYIQLAEMSPFDLWLLFLHWEPEPDARDLRAGCPGECPTGLFGGEIKRLAGCIHHRHDNWGRRGMVYWNVSDLRLIATVETVRNTISGKRPIVSESGENFLRKEGSNQ